MDVSNLIFFNKFGETLNLKLEDGYWQGSIFFEPLSVNLFDNENIFLLEEVGSEYKFPTLEPGQSIQFKWKTAENEGQYALYDVVRDPVIKEFFINKTQEQVVAYDDIMSMSPGGPIDISAPLQLNIAFNPTEEAIFERVLEAYFINPLSPSTPEKIMEIKFYGEGLEEDERFKIWAQNFGIRFNREDANILKDYDIKEALPDWKQINQSRKELLVSKEEVFPYIGTYKGLVNFINLLGYKDVLRIKEYWRNVNKSSEYFDKLFMVDLTDILDDGKVDNVNLLAENRQLKFGKQFKKTSFLALIYQFTVDSGESDDDGVPIVVPTTEFTVDEIFYKLNRLDNKLKNEFLPINVQIRDIIGEFIYFEKIQVKVWPDDTKVREWNMNTEIEVKCTPSTVDFHLQNLAPLFKKPEPNGIAFPSTLFNNSNTNPYDNNQRYSPVEIPKLVEAINTYYEELKNQSYPDLSKTLDWDYGDSPTHIIGAPVVFNVEIERKQWIDLGNLTWKDLDAEDPSISKYWTWQNFDFGNLYEIEWRITKDAPNPYNFTYFGKIVDLHTLPHFLPHAGTYNVVARIYDLYGNVTEFSKRITVSDQLEPEIIAMTRIEDKFSYRWKDLNHINWKDLGSATWVDININLLNNENNANSIDPFKNLLEWTFYSRNYGLGQNMYNVKILNENTNAFEDFNSSFHPRKSYWGLGDDQLRLTWRDFDGATWKDLFFLKWKDLNYHDDFLAGFYLDKPTAGDAIQISLFSDYIIPEFTSLQDLADQLNESNHPGIQLFNYEVIGGRIHAQADNVNKTSYHILNTNDSLSPASPIVGSSKYSFYEPIWAYSEKLIESLEKRYPAFDRETLFLNAKPSDIFSGAVQDPDFWVDKGSWKFVNDEQFGYLPSALDQNAFNLKRIKLFENTFSIPKWAPVFFFINSTNGKIDVQWTLYDEVLKENVIVVKDVPFFVWKFKDIGKFTLTAEVLDNRGTTYTNTIENFIVVKNSKDYKEEVENRLKRRKNKLPY